MRLYSKQTPKATKLHDVRFAGLSYRRPVLRQPHRHAQRRLNEDEAAQLAALYREGASITELAQRFAVHRTTVSALLQRHGVSLRRTGLTPEDVIAAGVLYADGWSLAMLGRKFRVDSTTIWRALRVEGVVMRSANERGHRD